MFGYYKFRRKIKNFYLRLKTPKSNGFDFERGTDELILLANGYTLDMYIDLEKLKGADVFVCNEFFRHVNYSNIIIENNVLHFALDGLISFERTIPKMEGLTVNESFEKYLNPILKSNVNSVIPISLFPYVLSNFPKSKIKSNEQYFQELVDLKVISKKK